MGVSTKREVPTGQAKARGRFSQGIYHVTKRLEGHTIALGVAATVVGAFFAYLAWASISGVPFQDRYEIKALVPSDSPILQNADAVRIAGRLAGLVTDVEPGPEAGSTEVTMEIRPQFAPIGKDAEASVRVKSLVYLTYLELDPGNLDDPLPEGATLPLEQGGSETDLLEVVQLFDRKARETLSRSIFNAGVGLAGRGGELNASLEDLPPVTENLTAQLEAATREPGAIARGVRGAQRVSSGLTGERSDDVSGLVGSGSEVLGAIANRRAELGETIELLPRFNDEFLQTAPLLDPVLDGAAGLARELDPVLADVALTLPELNAVLARGDQIRRETQRLNGLLRPVLRQATPVVRALQPTVAAVDVMVGPLDTLVSGIEPFARDITIGSEQLISATRTLFPNSGEGVPAGEMSSALRFAPIFSCHSNRNPYPGPGEAVDQRAPC